MKEIKIIRFGRWESDFRTREKLFNFRVHGYEPTWDLLIQVAKSQEGAPQKSSLKTIVPYFLKHKKSLTFKFSKVFTYYVCRSSFLVKLQFYILQLHYKMNSIISLRCFKHVNADCDVEIIISGNKSLILLNEGFIKNIQYKIILHL